MADKEIESTSTFTPADGEESTEHEKEAEDETEVENDRDSSLLPSPEPVTPSKPTSGEDQHWDDRDPSLRPSEVKAFGKSKSTPVAVKPTSKAIVDDKAVAEVSAVATTPALFAFISFKSRKLIQNAAALLNPTESNLQNNPTLVANAANLALSAAI